ncbi:MAG: type II CRISPR-associated endonuclease Cas1 [Enhydrobacter sp.]|nr:MAG: type II CRISPR-associated endonuclease Cas1 [Enhydrobacter sp.]
MSSVNDFIGAERVLEISSRCHIAFSGNRFAIERRDDNAQFEVPCDDVLVIMLESEQSTVTSAVLAACAERAIPVVVCRKHLPVGMSLPLDASWNAAEVRRLQSHALRGEAAARRLWRRTVRAKIFAQAGALDMIGAGAVARLKRLADSVRLDGAETVEAQAAAIYWRELLVGFERQNEGDPRNGILNWGYAVLLASIGRALTSLGLDPALGFGHSGQSNSWALACDLMEPYRPSIDRLVADAGRGGLFSDPKIVKANILALFALDGPAKSQIVETVRGYREFLDHGNESRVPYPDRPLVA